MYHGDGWTKYNKTHVPFYFSASTVFTLGHEMRCCPFDFLNIKQPLYMFMATMELPRKYILKNEHDARPFENP